MDTDELARLHRAERRRQTWTLTRCSLADSAPPRADSAEEGLLRVFQLSRDAWLLSGRAWPSYTRAEMPGRVLRPEPP